MTDNINEKIISIFAKHKKQIPLCEDERVVRNEDGFYYVCVAMDDNGRQLDENRLLEKSGKVKYIVKVLHNKGDGPHLYNYLVTGEKLLDFMTPYIMKEKDGYIVDIDKYRPDELA